jgi:hypothetical protein
MTENHEHAESADRLPDEGQQALSILQGLWQAQGQTSDDIGDSASCGTTPQTEGSRTCKAADQMGFDGLVEEVDPSEADDVQTAWRKKLEQEGKRDHEGTTLRDLVLGNGQESSQ